MIQNLATVASEGPVAPRTDPSRIGWIRSNGFVLGHFAVVALAFFAPAGIAWSRTGDQNW